MPVEILCVVCGKSFFIKPYQLGKNKCCSNACGQVLRSRNIRKKYDLEKMKKLYEKDRKTLRQIGKIFNIDPRWLSHLLKEYGVKMRKGSEAIKVQWENNPERRRKQRDMMSTGRERTEKYIKTIESKKNLHRAWAKKVKARDKVCQVCKSDKKLMAHHIKNIVDFPECRFDLNNGILLCAKCHAIEHSKERTRSK